MQAIDNVMNTCTLHIESISIVKNRQEPQQNIAHMKRANKWKEKRTNSSHGILLSNVVEQRRLHCKNE